MAKKKFIIQVKRTVREIYVDEFEVSAKDLDEAKCIASDKLTDVIAENKIDIDYNDFDDYVVLAEGGV